MELTKDQLLMQMEGYLKWVMAIKVQMEQLATMLELAHNNLESVKERLQEID